MADGWPEMDTVEQCLLEVVGSERSPIHPDEVIRRVRRVQTEAPPVEIRRALWLLVDAGLLAFTPQWLVCTTPIARAWLLVWHSPA